MALDDYAKKKAEEAQSAFGRTMEDSSVVDKAGLSTDSAIDSLSSPSSSSSEPSATRTPTEATAARKVSSPEKAASVYGERTREIPSEVNAAPVDLGAQISKQEPTARPVVAQVETDIPIVTPEKTAAEIISSFNHGETVIVPPSYTPTPPSSEYTDTSFVAAIQKEMPYLDRVTAERYNIDGEDIISVTAYRINEDTPFVLNFNSQTSAIVPQEMHDGRFDDVIVNVYNSQFIKPDPEVAEFRPSSNEKEAVKTDYVYVPDAQPERAPIVLPEKTADGLQVYLSQTHNNATVRSSDEGFVVECSFEDGAVQSIVLNPTTFTSPNAFDLPDELKPIYDDVRGYSEKMDSEIRAAQYLYGATAASPAPVTSYSAERIEDGFDLPVPNPDHYDFLVISSSAGTVAGDFHPTDYSSLNNVITVDIDKLIKTNPMAANALMRSASTTAVPNDVKQDLNNKNYLVYGISQYRGSFSREDYDTSALYSDTTVQYFADFPYENQLYIASDSFGMPMEVTAEAMAFIRLKDGSRKMVDKAEPITMPAKQLVKGMYNQGELQAGSTQYSNMVMPVAYILAASGAQATAADYTKNMKIAVFRDGDFYSTIQDSLNSAGVNVKKIENSTHIGEAKRSLHRQMRKSETALGYGKLAPNSAQALAARRADVSRRLASSSLTDSERDSLLLYDAQLVAQDLFDNLDLYSNTAFTDLCRNTGMYKANEEIDIKGLSDITNLRSRISKYSKNQGFGDFTRLSEKSLNDLLNSASVNDMTKQVIRLELNARRTQSVFRDAKRMKFKRFFMMTRLLQKIDGGGEISKGVMSAFRAYNSTTETIRLTRMMIRSIANYRRRHFARVNKIRAAAGKKAKLGVDGRVIKAAKTVGNGVNSLAKATSKQISGVAKAGVRKVAQTAQAQALSNVIAANRAVAAVRVDVTLARINNIAQTATARLSQTRFARAAVDLGRRARVPLGYATRGATKVAAVSSKAAAATKGGFQALGKIFSTIAKGANQIVLGGLIGALICVAVAWIVSIAGNVMIGMGSSIEIGVDYIEDAKTESIIEDTLKELDKRDTTWLKEAHKWSNNNSPRIPGFYDPSVGSRVMIAEYGCDEDFTTNAIHIAGYDLGVYEKTATGDKKVPYYRSNAKAIISCADAYIFSSYMDFADEFKDYAYKSTGENCTLPDGSSVAMPASLWDVTHYTDVTDSPIYTCDSCNCNNYEYFCNDASATAMLSRAKSVGSLKTNDALFPYSEKGCITHLIYGSSTANEKSYCGLIHKRLVLGTFSYEYYLCCPENESKGAGHTYAVPKLNDCDNYSLLYRETTVTAVPENAYRYNLASADTSCSGKIFNVSSYIRGVFSKTFNADKLKDDIAEACEEHPNHIIRVGTNESYRDYTESSINSYIDALTTSSGSVVISVICLGHYHSACNSSCVYAMTSGAVNVSVGTARKLSHCTTHHVLYSIPRDEEVTMTQKIPYYSCNGHCNGHTLNFCSGHVDALVSIYSHQDITKMKPMTDETGSVISGRYTYDGFEDNLVNPYTITAADHLRGYGSLKIAKSDDYKFYWNLWKEAGGSTLRPEMAFEKWNCDWEKEFGIVLESEYDISYEISEEETDLIANALGGDISGGIPKARYEFITTVIGKTVSNDITGTHYEDYTSHRFIRYMFRQYADTADLRGIKPINIESEITNYNHIAGIEVSSVLPGDVVISGSTAYLVIAPVGDKIRVLNKTVTTVSIIDIVPTSLEAYRLFDE